MGLLVVHPGDPLQIASSVIQQVSAAWRPQAEQQMLDMSLQSA